MGYCTVWDCDCGVVCHVMRVGRCHRGSDQIVATMMCPFHAASRRLQAPVAIGSLLSSALAAHSEPHGVVEARRPAQGAHVATA
eukprot:747684-Prymnesium_polylepis.1